jgi:hypothetical protein
VIAAPFAPKLKAEEEKPEIIIRAGHPGADNLEVYNQDTGEIQKFVRAVSLGRWVDVLTYIDPNPKSREVNNVTWKVTERRENGCTVQPVFTDYELPTVRVPGNWQVRQKPAPKTDERVGKDFFKPDWGAPAPFPVVYQKLGKS